MSNNEKINTFIENKLAPIMSKLASNKYINSINLGFYSLSPLIITCSIFILIFNLPFSNPDSAVYIKQYHDFTQYFHKYYVAIFNSSIGIISIFLSYSTAHALAEHYNLGKLANSFLSAYAFILLSAKTLSISAVNAASQLLDLGEQLQINVIDARYLNVKGIVLAIVCAIVSVEIYRLVVKINIRFPEIIPSAIAKTVESIIPFFIVSILCIFINVITEKYFNNTIASYALKVFEYLAVISDSLILIIFILLLVHILWFCGSIHGSNVGSVIINPAVLINLSINQYAIINGENLNRIFAGEFMNGFIYIGGAGATLGLCIAMLMCKNEEIKSIGKTSIVPGIFNINEPILFGTPIIMNGTFFIPFIFTPIINAVITYFAFKLNIISKIVAAVPWPTPSILNAFVSTNFSIKAPLLIICLFIIDYLIYKPFLTIHIKKIKNN